MPPPPPPPPPPAPPPPSGGFGGPPPPLLPGGASISSSLPARPAATKDRAGLLGDIQKGARLKKAVTNDRSAPIVGKESSGSSGGPPIGGAPPVPGLRPPVAPTANRARSNSDVPSRSGDASAGAAPQLGGLFAGGMPKLKKTGGAGVSTGAGSDSAYLSDPETSRSSVPKPPSASAPRPPGPPPIPGIAGLKNGLKPSPLHTATASPDTTPPRPSKPPPIVGKKPPLPPPTGRKPSTAPFPPPPPTLSAPTPPAPPPLPPSAAPSVPRASAAPPPPPPPPPPPFNTGATSSALGVSNARDIAGRMSPAIAPPPPPPPPPSLPSAPPPPPTSAPRPPPPPPEPPAAPPIRAPEPPSASLSAARSAAAIPPSPAPPPPPSAAAPSILRDRVASSSSMLGPEAYTLTNGGSSNRSRSNTTQGRAAPTAIHDPRWKFQDDSQLPKPRDFTRGQKRYRAGRVSTVPLDLSAFE